MPRPGGGRCIAGDAVRFHNPGCVSKVPETSHFTIQDRPNVHERKIESLSRSVNCRAVTPNHNYPVVLGDEFISFEGILFLRAYQGSEKAFFHLIGVVVFARVGYFLRAVKPPNQLIGQRIDYGVNVSLAESLVELFDQINVLLFLHKGKFLFLDRGRVYL